MRGELDVDDLLDIVDAFYAAATGEGGWERALARLTGAFEGTAAVFFVQDREASELSFSHLWGRPTEAMRDYESGFVDLDVGIEQLMGSELGTVLSEEAVPAAVRRSSPFFNEFRREWSVERYLGSAVFRGPRRIGVLAVQGEAGRRPFGEGEGLAMQRLIPHVRRAVELDSQVARAADRSAPFEELAEGLPIGVVVLDHRGEVTFANAAARGIVARGDGLAISRRRLRAAAPADDRRLGEAIAATLALAARGATGAGDPVSVGRREATQPYSVLAVPAAVARSVAASGAGRALVLIGDPEARLESPAEAVARLYGLTRSEAALVRALAGGETVASYAEQAGIAVSTARWTLKQAQAKTGCRRQTDLVRLLLTGPSAWAMSSRERNRGI